MESGCKVQRIWCFQAVVSAQMQGTIKDTVIDSKPVLRGKKIFVVGYQRRCGFAQWFEDDFHAHKGRNTQVGIAIAGKVLPRFFTERLSIFQQIDNDTGIEIHTPH